MLRFFENFPEIVAGMSLKEDGNMKLNCGDDSVLVNRQKIYEKAGVEKYRAISAALIHGENVEVVDEFSSMIIKETDALVTNSPGVVLTVTAADCPPVILYDRKNKVIAAIHSGWKGAISNLIPKTVTKMILIGAEVKSIHAEIGPHICEQCYEFDNKDLHMLKGFYHTPFVRSSKKPGKSMVVLKEIIRNHLIMSGVGKVKTHSQCTFENPKLWSARRDGSNPIKAGVMMIGMKKTLAEKRIPAKKMALAYI